MERLETVGNGSIPQQIHKSQLLKFLIKATVYSIHVLVLYSHMLVVLITCWLC